MKKIFDKLNSSIAYRVFIPQIIIMVVSFAFIFFIAYNDIANLKNDIISGEAASVRGSMEEATRMGGAILQSVAVTFSEDLFLKAAMHNDDYAEGKTILEDTYKLINELPDISGVHIEVFTKDKRLFASTVPNSDIGKPYEDRWLLSHIADTKKSLATTDVIKDGLVIRGIAPIIDNGTYLGTIEIFERIAPAIDKAAKKSGVMSLIAISPELSTYAVNIKNPRTFNGGTITNTEALDEGLLTKVSEEKLMPTDDYRIIGGFFITPVIIKDALGKSVGTLYTAKPARLVFAIVDGTVSISTNIVLMFLFSYVLIALMFYLNLFSAVLSPLKKLNLLIKDIAEGDGDLRKRLELNRHDEIGVASSQMDNFITQIQSAIALAADAANETSSSSEELSVTAFELSDNITEQLKIVAKTESLVTDVGENLDETEESAIATTEDLERTRDVLTVFVDKMRRMVGDVADESIKQKGVSSKMSEVNDSVRSIVTLLLEISEIADQTNLLALNASIEAARAGEHGKGFAVVADEVRKLAERTQNSLNNINRMTKSITHSVNDAFELVNSSAESIQGIATDAGSLIIDGDETITRLSKSTTVSSDVVKKTTYIAIKTKELIRIMETLVQLSKSNQKSGDNVTSVSDHLSNKATGLHSVLSKFKV